MLTPWQIPNLVVEDPLVHAAGRLVTFITLIKRTFTTPALRQVYDHCGLEGLHRLLRSTLRCPRCTPSARDGFPAPQGRPEYPQLELLLSYGTKATSRCSCICTAGFVWCDCFLDAPTPFLVEFCVPLAGLVGWDVSFS